MIFEPLRRGSRGGAADGVRAAAPVPTVTTVPRGNVARRPCGQRPAGSVLPSGRLVTPAGRSIVVRMDCARRGVEPGQPFAIVSNAPRAAPGSTARSIHTSSVVRRSPSSTSDDGVVDLYQTAAESFSSGSPVRHPQDRAHARARAAVRAMPSTCSRSTPRVRSRPTACTIAIPAARDPAYAVRISFPATLVVAATAATRTSSTNSAMRS